MAQGAEEAARWVGASGGGPAGDTGRGASDLAARLLRARARAAARAAPREGPAAEDRAPDFVPRPRLVLPAPEERLPARQPPRRRTRPLGRVFLFGLAAGSLAGLALVAALQALPPTLILASGPPPHITLDAQTPLVAPRPLALPALPAAEPRPSLERPPPAFPATARAALPPLPMLVETIRPRARPGGHARVPASRPPAGAPVRAAQRVRRDPLREFVETLGRIIGPAPLPEWARRGRNRRR